MQFALYASTLLQEDSPQAVRAAAASLLKGMFQSSKTLARDILADTAASAVPVRRRVKGEISRIDEFR